MDLLVSTVEFSIIFLIELNESGPIIAYI